MAELTRIAAVGLSGLGLVFWLGTLAIGVIGARRIRDLSRLSTAAPESWPLVSVIVAARDEIGGLAAAVRAHLVTSYPNLELILVDDRSTDGTAELIDALARQDGRVRTVHVRDLPDGWLGKVHALQRGWTLARGKWVLFTDADVQIAPDTLQRTVALCEAEGRDLLTVIPRFLPVGVLVDAAVTAMARAMFGGGQVWRAEDPAARQVAGFGAFLLVRHSVFARSAGFEALRMEIADDLGVGLVVKEAGGRIAVVRALDHVSLRFHGSLAELCRSAEKGGYAIIGRYKLARLIALCAASPAMELGPFAAFAPVGVSWLPAFGAIAVVIALLASVAGAWWLGRPLLSGILFPVGVVLNAAFNLRSGLIGWWSGGIRWRDTFYPVEALRRGQRVHWP
jgi:glycosyltransferase involved in cell wall biosynthesis